MANGNFMISNDFSVFYFIYLRNISTARTTRWLAAVRKRVVKGTGRLDCAPAGVPPTSPRPHRLPGARDRCGPRPTCRDDRRRTVAQQHQRRLNIDRPLPEIVGEKERRRACGAQLVEEFQRQSARDSRRHRLGKARLGGVAWRTFTGRRSWRRPTPPACSR